MIPAGAPPRHLSCDEPTRRTGIGFEVAWKTVAGFDIRAAIGTCMGIFKQM